jgi:hypothetical protein
VVFWWIYGGFMVDLWWIYVDLCEFMVDLCGFMVDLWWIYVDSGGFMVDLCGFMVDVCGLVVILIHDDDHGTLCGIFMDK